MALLHLHADVQTSCGMFSQVWTRNPNFHQISNLLQLAITGVLLSAGSDSSSRLSSDIARGLGDLTQGVGHSKV